MRDEGQAIMGRGSRGGRGAGSTGPRHVRRWRGKEAGCAHAFRGDLQGRLVIASSSSSTFWQASGKQPHATRNQDASCVWEGCRLTWGSMIVLISSRMAT